MEKLRSAIRNQLFMSLVICFLMLAFCRTSLYGQEVKRGETEQSSKTNGSSIEKSSEPKDSTVKTLGEVTVTASSLKETTPFLPDVDGTRI